MPSGETGLWIVDLRPRLFEAAGQKLASGERGLGSWAPSWGLVSSGEEAGFGVGPRCLQIPAGGRRKDRAENQQRRGKLVKAAGRLAYGQER